MNSLPPSLPHLLTNHEYTPPPFRPFHPPSSSSAQVAKRELPLLRLMARISPAALAISVSVGTSMLIFPFFTYMSSTGLLGVRFAQVRARAGAGGCIGG